MTRAALFAVWLAVARSASAWDAAGHHAITRAALDAAAPIVTARLGSAANDVIQTYSMLPDGCRDWRELPDAAAMRPFCLRPDGEPVHSATFDKEEDLGSLVYLYERILTSASSSKDKDLAMYVGVLAHFVEDSLSPPHSVTAEELEGLAPDVQWLHQKLERAAPSFTIAKRPVRESDSETMLEVLDGIVTRLHASAARNRQALPELVKALQSEDEKLLNALRLRAAKDAADLLADALNAMLGRQF